MYDGGQAADQMVSYAFKGGEVVLRLSGDAAKHLAVYLANVLKEGGPGKGKTTLRRMIGEGKELTVQRIAAKEIPYFNDMAKKYGVRFVVIKDKQHPDGTTDIMFRAEDAAIINRIFDRLKISEHPNVAQIKSEIIRDKASRNPQKAQDGTESRQAPTADNRNQAKGRTKSPSPSAPISNSSASTTMNSPSVRAALKNIHQARTAGDPAFGAIPKTRTRVKPKMKTR